MAALAEVEKLLLPVKDPKLLLTEADALLSRTVTVCDALYALLRAVEPDKKPDPLAPNDGTMSDVTYNVSATELLVYTVAVELMSLMAS